jgi:flagellar P-ring protein precursor FlgI
MRQILVIFVAAVCFAPSAFGVKIADITRINTQRTNTLTGFGLITGLKGTGDGGDNLPEIKALSQLLGAFANEPGGVKELADVQNVAIVLMTATMPRDGVFEGDKLDVYVTSVGKSTSLKGGRLFPCPMQGPRPSRDGAVWAMSSGPVVLEDPSTPTAGIVKGGCVMETDWHMQYVISGKLTLVLEDPTASWTAASAIAQVVNDSEANGRDVIAVAIDPKTVEITLPATERDRPDAFISRVQRLPIPERLLNNEARVQINEKTGSLILTGDVEISPVVISHKGLTITTINPAPVPTARSPVTTSKDIIPLDTTNTGGAKLQDLVNALDQLKVPAEDRITIIKELYKTGKLHAKLITE